MRNVIHSRPLRNSFANCTEKMSQQLAQQDIVCFVEFHTKRACYQAAVHRRALKQVLNAPSPAGYGWNLKGLDLEIKWFSDDTTLDDMYDIVSCKCQANCSTKRCKCNKNGLSCTKLCHCTECSNTNEEEVEEDENDEDEHSDADECSDNEDEQM